MDYYEKILLCSKDTIIGFVFTIYCKSRFICTKRFVLYLYNNEHYRDVDDVMSPGLPYSHGLSEDYQSPAPVGNGLLVLSLLGAGYLVKKSRKNRNKKNNIKIIFLGMMILGLGFSAEAQNFYFPKPADNFDGTNMTILGQLKIDGEFATENIEIGAFCGDEVRGRAFIRKLGSTYRFFLTLYGNTNDVMNLKFYDHSLGTELNVSSDFIITYNASGTNLNAGVVNYYTIKYKFIGTDKDWNKISNWQLVCELWDEPQNATQLPSSNPEMIDDIIVAANLDATSDYIVKDLEIISEKILTIVPSASLEIIGDITNDDVNALVVDSDINGTGSLIHNDDNVVAKVNCHIDNSSVTRNWNADWHFISSPVANQTIESFIPTEENYDFYSWSEFNSTWYNQKKDNSATNYFYVDNGLNFNIGRGYLVAYENEGYKKFSGTLNNGDVTYPLSCSTDGEFVVERFTGFNLVGNPYPSYIDWEAEGWTRDVLEFQTIWIYDDDVNNYITYTLGGVATNGGSQYIAPCQAFFVKAASAGNIIMTNDIRTNEKSSFRKNDNENIFKLRVNGASGQDEIAVVDGDNDDVFKMFSLNESAPSLYINKGVGSYSVVYVDDEESLPLNFEGGFAEYTISLSECGDSFDAIILEDKLTGEKVNLQTESYTFIHSGNSNAERFVLSFVNGQQTADNSHFAYINNGEIIINDINGNAQINIYDVTGRRVYNNANMDAACYVHTGGYSSGVYIIQKIDDKGIKTQKILLNN